MKDLTIIFFSTLLSLSLVGQTVISPGAGDTKTSKGIVVAWAIGDVIGGEIPALNSQGTEYVPITAIAPINYSDEHVVDQTMLTASLSISPNPAKDKVSIQFKDFTSSIFTVRILNYTGQEVHQQEVSDIDGPFLFDVSSFTAGTYILQAVDENHQAVTEKLFIF